PISADHPTELRAPTRDPSPARPDPIPGRPDRGANRGEAAGGEVARGRPDQTAGARLGHLRGVRAGDDGALIAGQPTPQQLAQLARGRMRAKLTALEEAFTG